MKLKNLMDKFVQIMDLGGTFLAYLGFIRLIFIVLILVFEI